MRESVRGGNERHANAARFIAAQSWRKGHEPHELVLLCWVGDDDPQIVCRWPFELVTEQLGFKISELVEDYAEDERQHCKARLEFRAAPGPGGASGEVLASKKMRGIYNGANSLGMGQGIAYDGSMGAILAQNQKHIEAVAQSNFKLIELVEGRNVAHFELMDRIVSRIEEMSTAHATRERARADELEERLRETEDMLERAVSTAETNAKAVEEAQDQDRVGQVIELVQKQLTARTDK